VDPVRYLAAVAAWKLNTRVHRLTFNSSSSQLKQIVNISSSICQRTMTIKLEIADNEWQRLHFSN
jgi:hypothetical protein